MSIPIWPFDASLNFDCKFCVKWPFLIFIFMQVMKRGCPKGSHKEPKPQLICH